MTSNLHIPLDTNRNLRVQILRVDVSSHPVHFFLQPQLVADSGSAIPFSHYVEVTFEKNYFLILPLDIILRIRRI